MTERRAGVASYRVVAIAACLGLAYCSTSRDSASAEPSTHYLDAWFSCIECSEGQLDSLESHSGGHERDRVLGELTTAALTGPTESVRSAIRSLAESDYDAVQASLARLKRDQLLSSKDEYAENEVHAYIRRYRTRGAVALLRIDQARGTAVIDSAMRSETDSTLLGLFIQMRRANQR